MKKISWFKHQTMKQYIQRGQTFVSLSFLYSSLPKVYSFIVSL